MPNDTSSTNIICKLFFHNFIDEALNNCRGIIPPNWEDKDTAISFFQKLLIFLTLGSLVLPALNKESSRASYAGLKLSQYRSIAENSSFLLLRFVELL